MSRPRPSCRPYHAELDRPAVEALWRATLEPTWPVLPLGLDRLRAGLVAVDQAGAPIGFVAYDRRDDHGGIALLLVAPGWQRHGLGTELLRAALDQLDTPLVRAGSGGHDYLWPGVPLDLPAAVAFFTAHGWPSEHDVMDLTQDLRDHRPAPRTPEVRTAVAGAAELAEVLDFEAEHFPQWSRHFADTDEHVLLARDVNGRLLGTLLFSGPDAPLTYRPLLGAGCAEIGCLGVAPRAQNRGVGSAMIAHASQVLHERGARQCLIGWAVRESFYRRAGYRPWRQYRTFEAPAPATPGGECAGGP